ncbi:hypothetical protein ACIQXA_40185 [Streptomyces massasporeus]|uniref:hypothetical protein n=1 Tax=Streptomyces massasporeus TaxID=67324 RepID=UPI0038024977
MSVQCYVNLEMFQMGLAQVSNKASGAYYPKLEALLTESGITSEKDVVNPYIVFPESRDAMKYCTQYFMRCSGLLKYDQGYVSNGQSKMVDTFLVSALVDDLVKFDKVGPSDLKDPIGEIVIVTGAGDDDMVPALKRVKDIIAKHKISVHVLSTHQCGDALMRCLAQDFNNKHIDITPQVAGKKENNFSAEELNAEIPEFKPSAN